MDGVHEPQRERCSAHVTEVGLGQRVAGGELRGAGLEVDRGRLVAALEAADELLDVAVELVGVDAGRGLHPDDAVDDGGLHGLAPAAAVDDLDGEAGAVGDGHGLRSGWGW